MGALKGRHFLPSPEGRLAVLLYQSRLPEWCLLRLGVELERQARTDAESQHMSVANAIVQLVENKHELPAFLDILQDMRGKGDASKLDDVIKTLNKAGKEVASIDSLVQETAARCADYLGTILLCLHDGSMSAPGVIQLPISNDSQLIEVAGFVGVAERAAERSQSITQLNAEKRTTYENTLQEARSAALRKAEESAIAYIAHGQQNTRDIILGHKKSFTTSRELKELNGSLEYRWRSTQGSYARGVSVPFPDGTVRSVTPLIGALPTGSTLSMTLGEQIIVAARRSGLLGGGSLCLAGVAAGVFFSAGASALIPAVGGAIWGTSNVVGREADRVRWIQRCSDALMKREPGMREQLMSAWNASYESYRAEIEKFFNIDKRTELLQRIRIVAGAKSKPV